MVVGINITVLWDMTPCNVVDRYRVRRTCYIQL